MAVSPLSVQRRTTSLNSHCISHVVFIVHGPPRMILWRWLVILDITIVEGQFFRLNYLDNIFSDANITSSGVYQVCAVFHVRNEFLSKWTLRTLVQWTLDGNSIRLSSHVLRQSCFSRCRLGKGRGNDNFCIFQFLVDGRFWLRVLVSSSNQLISLSFNDFFCFSACLWPLQRTNKIFPLAFRFFSRYFHLITAEEFVYKHCLGWTIKSTMYKIYVYTLIRIWQ